MPHTVLLSPATIGDLACPLKFHTLRELRAWPQPPSPAVLAASARGQAIHAVLSELYRPTGSMPLPDMSRLDAALDEGMRLLRLKPADREAGRGDLSELACLYTAEDCGGYRVLSAEKEHQFTLSNGGRQIGRLVCRHDRLQVPLEEPETLVVVDIATGRKQPCDWSIWLSLAVARAVTPGFKRHRLEIHRLSVEGVTVERYPAGRYRGVSTVVTDAVLNYLTSAAQDTYPAIPGEACLYCPLRSVCPAEVPLDAADLEFDEAEE